MKRTIKSGLPMLLVFVLLLALSVPVFAYGDHDSTPVPSLPGVVSITVNGEDAYFEQDDNTGSNIYIRVKLCAGSTEMDLREAEVAITLSSSGIDFDGGELDFTQEGATWEAEADLFNKAYEISINNNDYTLAAGLVDGVVTVDSNDPLKIAPVTLEGVTANISGFNVQNPYMGNPNEAGWTFINYYVTATLPSETDLSDFKGTMSLDGGADNHGNNFGSASPITVGSTVRAGIDCAGDIDYFTFTPSTSGLYSIETTGSTDTVAELFDSSLTQISLNDDLEDTNARIIYYLDAGQAYYAKVRHYSSNGTGAYGFKVVSQYDDNLTQRTIRANNTLSGTIDCPGDIDIFAFTPSETGSYVIESISSTDLKGTLYNSSVQIGFDDDSGNGYNFRMVKTLTAGQRYYIGVACYYKSDTGAYTISVIPGASGHSASSVSSQSSVSTLEADNDGLSWKAIRGYIEENEDWTKADAAGLSLLYYWLYGGNLMTSFPTLTITNDNDEITTYPVADIFNNVAMGGKYQSSRFWGPYMMKNDCLTNGNPDDGTRGVKELLQAEFDSVPDGSTRNINIIEHVAMENGESMIGYNYLHGTNSKVGDFKITGTATKDTNGKVTAKLYFEWNDVIDPNFQYETDILKAQIAQMLPGSNNQDYIIRIGWEHTVVVNVEEPAWWRFWMQRTSWPFAN
ncbi:MAG: hypothetical protein AAGU27_15055 [Dehalobacterium sp.]